MRADVKTLRQQRKDLLKEIDRLRTELEQGEVDPSEDEADPEVAEREKILALLGAMDRRLEDVEHALEQAEDGSYGVCEACGKRIGRERLKVVPEATMCVSCKALAEKHGLVAPRTVHRSDSG